MNYYLTERTTELNILIPYMLTSLLDEGKSHLTVQKEMNF